MSSLDLVFAYFTINLIIVLMIEVQKAWVSPNSYSHPKWQMVLVILLLGLLLLPFAMYTVAKRRGWVW